MAQRGAVVLAGRHDMMQDCIVEAMNASGATFAGEEAIVRRCVFRHNGQLGFGAGRAHRLLLTECLIENNNTKGFDRGWEAGGNKLALCRDAQVWGWFDVNDGRHWPAKSPLGAPKGEAMATKPGDLAGWHSANTRDGQPQGLTLEKLRLRFDNNIYFAAPGQGWFKWGPTWTRHKSFASLSEFQSELGIDSGGRVTDPEFADWFQLDFRLDSETMSRLQECYPRGPVPGVLLGVAGAD
jgi:hypothetical protein